MPKLRATLLAVLLAAVMFATQGSSATAHPAHKVAAHGNVKAERGPTGESGGPFKLRFKASGTTTEARGHFAYTEPSGYTLRGDVTCYYQVGNRAVFTGPVTYEANPDNNTESIVIWVADNDPGLGGRDAFDVAGGALLGPDCDQNFPLDRFDDAGVQASLYYVTKGNIVVRTHHGARA